MNKNERALDWVAWYMGCFGVSACLLLKKRRHQGGRKAEYKAYQPHRVDPDHGCFGRKWLIRDVNRCRSSLGNRRVAVKSAEKGPLSYRGIEGQRFVEINDEGAYSRREKACLGACH